MDLDCTCNWRYVWHGYGPEAGRGLHERTPVIVEHDKDCPIPEHAALAALLTPAPDEREDEEASALHDRLVEVEDFDSIEPEDRHRLNLILPLLKSTVPSNRDIGRVRARDFLASKGLAL